MKIAICAANKVGAELSKFIAQNNHPIEFVITHQNDPHEEEICAAFSSCCTPCYSSVNANDDFFIDKIKKHDVDLVLLLWWPNIVKQKSIDAANLGFINMHPSLLPFNRGMHPYYWSIVDETPAGVSLHFINAGIDDGDILFQNKIETPITMTGDILYDKSVNCIVQLFKDNYNDICMGKLNPKRQDEAQSTFHLAKDIEQHSNIELDRKYKAIDLINIMRARSFKGRPSSYFIKDGKKYYINITITEDTNG